MNEVVKKTIDHLKRRQFDVSYAKTKEEGKDIALSLIPEGVTVCWGGSKTATEIGLIDAVRESGKYILLDRDAVAVEDRAELMKKGLTAHTFIASINGVSSDGWLVNIDGTGNRVAATIYGPENVILVIGVNKIADGGLHEAIYRARNMSAPPNTVRLNKNTPCAKLGKCVDCLSPDTICSQFVLTRYCKPAGRIKIVIINDTLGF